MKAEATDDHQRWKETLRGRIDVWPIQTSSGYVSESKKRQFLFFDHGTTASINLHDVNSNPINKRLECTDE